MLAITARGRSLDELSYSRVASVGIRHRDRTEWEPARSRRRRRAQAVVAGHPQGRATYIQSGSSSDQLPNRQRNAATDDGGPPTRRS